MDLDKNIQRFCESFYRDRPKYVKFAVGFLRDRTAAEDLVNDSFVLFWENRSRLAEDTVCEAYFYTIVKNRCLNYLRDKQTHYEIEGRIQENHLRLLQYDLMALENYDPNLIFSNEIRAILFRQLELMPERTRNIFCDNRLENMTYAEIAAKYDISIWKVAREMQSALQMLRLALKDYLPLLLLLLASKEVS